MDLEKIILSIKKWRSESTNFRNDGWVMEHYRNNILEVKNLIDSFQELKHEDKPSYKDLYIDNSD